MKSIHIYPLIMVLSLLLVSCAGETDTPNGPADTGQDAGTVDTEEDVGQGADTSIPDLECVDGDTGAVLDGWCLIDGLCVEEGDANPDAPCQVCDPDGATDGWTAAADDTLCTVDTEDGEADGTCQGGLCVPHEDITVDCDCEGESACCDGCNVINVGEDCGDEDLPCTTNTCMETGVCEQTVLDGWCLTGHGTEEAPHLCADLATDSAHCGACDQACDHDQHCEGGECVRTCELELDLCNGECVDLQTHESHCGACDSPCTEETVCHGGECIIPVEEVLMEPEELHLTAGSTGAFTVTITPEDATHQTITWESEDTDVATVDEEGVITALTKGETTITATAGGKSASGLVTVTVSVGSVSIDPPALSLFVGEEGVLTPLFDPPNADDQRVTWSSDDEGVVLVNENGAVTGLTPGEAIITVTAADGGFIATCLVTVVIMPVDSVEVTPADATIEVDYTVSLTPTVAPANATDQTVTWSTSHQDVATVDETGLVTGVSAGVAEITATTVCGGHTDTATITVLQPVTGVELSPERLLIPINSTGQFNLTVLPVDASNKDVTWLSDNWAVASIDGTTGLITGLQEGEATITVFTHDGDFQTEATVQVYIPVSGITIDQSSLVMTPEETGALTATIAPEDATFTEVFWESLDDSVATVDQDGVVTPVNVGTTTIRVWTEDGDFSDTISVVVRIPVTGVVLYPEEITLSPGDTEEIAINLHPGNGTVETMVWQSQDTDVATVTSDGEVTAVGLGSTVIRLTATTADGEYTADCMVNVSVYLWFTTQTSSEYTSPEKTVVDGDDNLFLTGYFHSDLTFEGYSTFYSGGYSDAYVAKYNSDGQILWAKTAGGVSSDMGTAIGVDPDGNVTIAGTTQSSPMYVDGEVQFPYYGGDDIFLIQYDSYGVLNWAKSFGSPGADTLIDFTADQDGNLYMVGWFSNDNLDFGGGNLPYGGRPGSFLVKLDSQGNHVWSKGFPSHTGGNYANRVIVDNEGNVIVGGKLREHMEVEDQPLTPPLAGQDGLFMAKYDGDGNKLWARSWGGNMPDIKGLAVDGEDNIHVTGFYRTEINWGGDSHHTSNYSFYLTKLDSNGDYIWSKGMEDSSQAKCFDLAVDESGSVFIAGNFTDQLNLGGDTHYDDNWAGSGFLGKYDSDGTLLWEGVQQTDIGIDINGRQLGINSKGQVYYVGNFFEEANFEDTTLTVPGQGIFIVKLKP